jgi:hypothetical protein
VSRQRKQHKQYDPGCVEKQASFVTKSLLCYSSAVGPGDEEATRPRIAFAEEVDAQGAGKRVVVVGGPSDELRTYVAYFCIERHLFIVYSCRQHYPTVPRSLHPTM